MNKPKPKKLTAWPDPQTLGFTASQAAQIVDENKPHHDAGVIEALSYLITAAHRIAEAIEQLTRVIDDGKAEQPEEKAEGAS